MIKPKNSSHSKNEEPQEEKHQINSKHEENEGEVKFVEIKAS